MRRVIFEYKKRAVYRIFEIILFTILFLIYFLFLAEWYGEQGDGKSIDIILNYLKKSDVFLLIENSLACLRCLRTFSGIL